MSVCWKPGWCECPECGPLTQVVGEPNTCVHNVVRLDFSEFLGHPCLWTYCDRCQTVLSVVPDGES